MGAGWVFDAEHKKLVASVTSLTTSCLVLTEKIPSKMRDKISFHLLFQKLLCGNMRQFSIAKQRMSRYLVQ